MARAARARQGQLCERRKIRVWRQLPRDPQRQTLGRCSGRGVTPVPPSPQDHRRAKATAQPPEVPRRSRPVACADAIARLRRAATLVKEALEHAVPEELTPDDARRLTGELGALEKLVAASAVRCSQRAGRDAAAVLALAQGSTVTRAKRGLSLLEHASAVPVVDGALRDGAVSLDQVAVIAPAIRATPEALGTLLDRARSASIAELRDEVARSLRRARSEEAQVAVERRLHQRRFCRLSFPDGGGVRLQAFFGPIQGARVKAALADAIDARFRAASGSGDADEEPVGGGRSRSSEAAQRGETLDHRRADALADLVTGSLRGARGTAGPHILVRVDAASLRRGAVGDGEICEIAGVGPVSIESARTLLGEGFFTVLVEDGVDIRTVSSTRRAIPRRVRAALMLRDRTCVVPGCGATDRLEIDHWRLDFGRHGPTELDNLCRLCPTHHSMKTEQGWQLLGGPGHWRWLSPKPVAELAARRGRRLRAAGSPARQTGRRPRAGPPKGRPSNWTPP